MPTKSLACLLFAAALSAQTGSSSIEGKVVNSVTGAPVKRAAVRLALVRRLTVGPAAVGGVPLTLSAETDEQGAFVLRNLAAGLYALDIQRQGYLQRYVGRQPSNLPLADNQQVTGIVARLVPHGVIAGRVLDVDGEPVAEVNVMALRWGNENGKRQFVMVANTTGARTNDLGEFRIAGLPAGSYYVQADAPRAFSPYPVDPSQPDSPRAAYVATYYPSAADPAAAKAVQVEAGAVARATDIRLARLRTVSVRGRVVDPGALPNRSAYVMMSRRGAGGMFGSVGESSMIREGVFRISGVPPGSYYLRALLPDERGQSRDAGVVPVDVANDPVEGVVIKLAPAVDLEGTVVFPAGGRCLTGSLMLSRESGYINSPYINPSADGKFRLKSLVPGEYAIRQSGIPGCYIDSIRYNGRESKGGRFSVDAPGRIEISLASDTTVEGSVADASGKPVRGALISFHDKQSGEVAATAISRPDGAFSASGMRPGVYDVFAWENSDYTTALASAATPSFASRAVSVTVEAARRQTVPLTVIPAAETGQPISALLLDLPKASLEGVVQSATGAPLANAKVSISSQPRYNRSIVAARGAAPAPAPAEATADTDEQGRFSVRDVEPGIYFVSAERQGFLDTADAQAQSVILGIGQRLTGHVIRLTPQSVLTGRITDEFGDPVSGAQIHVHRAEYTGGMRTLPRVGDAQSDDVGRFRVPGVSPGTYYLSVAKPARPRFERAGLPALPTEPETGLGVVWYPNSPDPTGAAPVVVAAGGDVPVDIVLRRARVFRIRGTVVDDRGAPVDRAALGAGLRGIVSALSVGDVTTAPGGQFEIANLPAGQYTLWARSSGAGASGAPIQRQAILPIELRDRNLEGVELRIAPGRIVRGTVKLEAGATPSGYLNAFAPEGYSASTPLMRATDAFTVGPIWPLSYAVDVAGLYPGCYLKSIRYAGRDVRDSPIPFASDGELELVVSGGAGSFEGATAPGATILLVAADNPLRRQSTRADATGAWSFANLRPAAYRLYAFEGPAPDDPDRWQSQSTLVTLKESAKETVRLVAVKR